MVYLLTYICIHLLIITLSLWYIYISVLFLYKELNLSKAETRTVLRRMSSIVGGPVDQDNFYYALNIDFSSQQSELRKTPG